MAKIGASGKNILRGRAPWAGIPQAGRGGKSSNLPFTRGWDGTYPDGEGEVACPEINGMSNPYNYKSYMHWPGTLCHHPGGGAHTVNPDGTYVIDDCNTNLAPSNDPNTPNNPFKWNRSPVAFKDIEDKFKNVGDTGIKDSNTIGFGAGWGVPTEMRTVVAVFWPSQSEMESYTGPDWTQQQFMDLMGTNLKNSIRNYTHGQLEMVGGSGLPDTGVNSTDLDFYFVGNPHPAGETSWICGNPGHPINCGCGGAIDPNATENPMQARMRKWFFDNGLVAGTNTSTGEAQLGYDLKIAIFLGCIPDQDLAGQASGDPLVWVAVNPTVGLANDPPVLMDITDPNEVLGDKRVTQVVLHEIVHSIGHGHTAKYQGIAGGFGQSYCYDNYNLPPSQHCDKASWSYEGADNLDLMSFGGASQNRFPSYEHAHPTAYKKFITNKAPRPATGYPDRIHTLEKFPPQCVHFPDPLAEQQPGIQKVQLHAHDQNHDDPNMVANLADSKTMILIIRRDIDLSEMSFEQNCQTGENRLTPERYVAISYRRHAFFRPLDVHGPTTDGPSNGAIVFDWGPIGTHPMNCGSPFDLANQWNTGTIKKISASDFNTTVTFDAYTANGRFFPKLEVTPIENVGHPGDVGPPAVTIEIKRT
tara:strand:+ start:1875 stop:3800 length:1926 start_codon:yes stop_codon:yes gene_type:complete